MGAQMEGFNCFNIFRQLGDCMCNVVGQGTGPTDKGSDARGVAPGGTGRWWPDSSQCGYGRGGRSEP